MLLFNTSIVSCQVIVERIRMELQKLQGAGTLLLQAAWEEEELVDHGDELGEESQRSVDTRLQ